MYFAIEKRYIDDMEYIKCENHLKLCGNKWLFKQIIVN